MFLPTFAKGLMGLGCGSLLLACSLVGTPDEDSSPDTTGAGEKSQVAAPADPAAAPPPPPPSPLPTGLNLPGDPPAPGAAPSPAPVPSTPSPALGRTIYATDLNAQLLTFTSGEPAKVATRAISGLGVGERIVGLSYNTGKLAAIGTSSKMFFVDAPTASLSPVSIFAFAAPLDGDAFGFSFDPVTKLARVVSNTGQNIRVGGDAVVTNVDDTLVWTAGDPNVARVPYVVTTAYSAAGKAYAIDTRANVLVELLDSFSGRMRTVGALGVDPGDVAGFDIRGGDAFAALRVGNTTGLYTIDLATGAAKLVGAIGVTTPISGLAIAP